MQWNWQHKNWPNWKFDPQVLEKLEAEYLLASGRLLGAWQHLLSEDRQQMQIDLLSDEAVRTSAIEGEFLNRASVQSSVKRQFGLSAPRTASPAETGIAELMVSCFENYADPLTPKTLFEWHKLVCRGRKDLKTIGAYRTHTDPMQIVSGAVHKPKVHFEAPPSETVTKEMNAFVKWFVRTAPDGKSPLPALTRAGLSHLYFVTVHPFEDGNGRMARALSEKVLAQAVGQPSLLALSRQIEKDRKNYYQSLHDSNRKLDATNWLLWFAQTILDAQIYSLAMVDHLIAKTKLLDRLRGNINARQEKALLRVFEAGPDGFLGGLGAKNYCTITGASPATARRDLVDLLKKNALTRTGERRSTRYWLNLEN